MQAVLCYLHDYLKNFPLGMNITEYLKKYFKINQMPETIYYIS